MLVLPFFCWKFRPVRLRFLTLLVRGPAEAAAPAPVVAPVLPDMVVPPVLPDAAGAAGAGAAFPPPPPVRPPVVVPVLSPYCRTRMMYVARSWPRPLTS